MMDKRKSLFKHPLTQGQTIRKRPIHDWLVLLVEDKSGALNEQPVTEAKWEFEEKYHVKKYALDS